MKKKKIDIRDKGKYTDEELVDRYLKMGSLSCDPLGWYDEIETDKQRDAIVEELGQEAIDIELLNRRVKKLENPEKKKWKMPRLDLDAFLEWFMVIAFGSIALFIMIMVLSFLFNYAL
jgi:hypothetical protein